MPSARALSQTKAEPSGQDTEEVNSNDVEVIYSEEAPKVAMIKVLETESDAGSHQGRACC